MAVKFLFLLNITVDTTQFLKNLLITVKPVIKRSPADWMKPELTSLSLPVAVVSSRGSFQSSVTSAEGRQVPWGWTPGTPQRALRPSVLQLAAPLGVAPRDRAAGGARPRGSRPVRRRPSWTRRRGCAGAQGTGRLGPVGTPPRRTPPSCLSSLF